MHAKPCFFGKCQNLRDFVKKNVFKHWFCAKASKKAFWTIFPSKQAQNHHNFRGANAYLGGGVKVTFYSRKKSLPLDPKSHTHFWHFPPQAEKWGELFWGGGQRKSKKIVIKKWQNYAVKISNIPTLLVYHILEKSPNSWYFQSWFI